MRVHIYPLAQGEDKGEGGVGRVVRGQMQHLAQFGWEVTANPAEADVIACHITIPDEYLNLYPNKAFVAHCHGLYWAEYEWPKWALRANGQVLEAIRVADACTVPSQWVRDVVARHTMRPPVAIPHGVDLEYFQPPKERGPYVWWDKTRPDAVCDPEPMNALADLMPDVPFVSTFGAPGRNVTITGRLAFAEAAEMTRNAGVYLATTRETFGIATLQALACGVPAVGYNWGATPEIIEHERDGWLVEPGDLSGLVEGVRWALSAEQSVLKACREKAEQYPWANAARMYARLYSEVVARKRQKPRTSVIVTAYNLDEYLDDCLASVAAQTDPDLECIVVDDASPDRCGEIADQWAARDPRFKAVHNSSNLYLAGARNAGIEASRGRYILPLDADDMLPLTAVGELAGALDRNRKIHVAYGNVRFLEPDGKEWHSGWPMPFRLEWQLKRRNLLPYSSMYRREVAEWTGGYRRRCRTAEDADFWCRVSSYGFRPEMVTNADTLIYRNREGSMSRVNAEPNWPAWFPWRDGQQYPAGAVVEGLLPVPSLHPPGIAVIIPVGPGHGRYVLDAVDSVDAQTYREWECIVVNDSGEPLPTLPPWVKMLDTGGSAGVAKARNLGIAACSADLFLPLDADDYFEPTCLEEMLMAFRRTGGRDVIYSDFWEDPHEPGVFSRFATPDYQPEHLLRFGLPWAVTQLTPTAYWRAVEGYDSELPTWEDWGFALAMAEKGICSTRIAAPLWTYRKHTGNRRDDNLSRRDEGEAAIRARFGQYWDGKETLMACNSCGGGRKTQAPQVPIDPLANAPKPPEGDFEVVVVTYVGEKTGAVRYRAPSGTVYSFGSRDQRRLTVPDGTPEDRRAFVLAQDAEWFAARPGFVVERVDPAPAAVAGEPVLRANTP